VCGRKAPKDWDKRPDVSVFSRAGFAGVSAVAERSAIRRQAWKGSIVHGQKALPLMRDGGSIVMTSSIASVKGFPGRTAYATSKAGLRAFARVWTTELKGRKIRSNLLTPGPVNTPQTARLPREAINQVVSSVPLGRIAEVDEIANAALFLASDESAFVTGSAIRRRRAAQV
jgi:NAD(P)-dependent dehydrogenase (short-subunit alcohol dehydrogenase family)